MLKKFGLLERVKTNSENNTCATCGGLVKLSETALGCAPHDKLILPDYSPYHGTRICPDWVVKE